MRAIRWTIIRVAEFALILLLLANTIVAGYFAKEFVVFARERYPHLPLAFDDRLAFAGGAALGFISGAVVLATFFLLVEIAVNTRKTVAFFERVNRRVDHD